MAASSPPRQPQPSGSVAVATRRVTASGVQLLDLDLRTAVPGSPLTALPQTGVPGGAFCLVVVVVVSPPDAQVRWGVFQKT